MALQRADELPATDIPKLNRAANGTSCEQDLAIASERQVVDMLFGYPEAGIRAAPLLSYSHEARFVHFLEPKE